MSLLLRFSSDFLVSIKCKAIFAVTSFRNSSAQFFKPAWCSNFSKLCSSLANIRHCLKQFCESLTSLFFTVNVVLGVDYS